MTRTYKRNGKEYRKDDQASGDEDVYSTRHSLHDIECPECGSDDVEVVTWDQTMYCSVVARCGCGFEHRADYSHREILDRKQSGEWPVEHVIFEIGADPDRWYGSWEFSPRLFIAMIDD